MLISFRHRLIYVKTFKTGGSSVQALLSRYCGDDDIWTAVTDATGTRFVVSGRNDSGWRPHMALRDIVAVLGGSAGPMRHVAVVRNPWDFAVSWYWWRTRNGPANARATPPEEYLRLFDAPLEEVRIAFQRWLSTCRLPDNMSLISRDHRMDLDVVLRYESLVGDVALLFREIGVSDPPELPLIKSGIRRPDLPYAAYYDRVGRERVENMLRATVECFGYRFDTR
jgi:hypothetical protein